MTELKRKIWTLIRGIKFRGYFRSTSGYPNVLIDCMTDKPASITVYGNSIQNGTPSPDNPADIMMVGDKTGNLFDKEAYKTSELWAIHSSTVNEDILSTRDGGNNIHLLFPAEFLGLKENTVYTIKINATRPQGEMTTTIPFVIMYTDGTSSVRSFIVSEFGVYDTWCYQSAANKTISSIGLNNAYNQIVRIDLSSIHIVEGSYTADTMPPYEPYGYKLPLQFSGENGGEAVKAEYNLYLDEPLRGIEGYCDTLELDAGNRKAILTRNIYYGIFPYTNESTYAHTTLNYVNIGIGGELPILKNEVYNSGSNAKVWSDKLPFLAVNGWTDINKEFFFANGNLNLIAHLLKTRVGFNDDEYNALATDTEKTAYVREKGIAYLSENPITISYVLQEPIIADISDKIDWNAIPKLWRGNITVSADTTVRPSAMGIEYYSTSPEGSIN